MTYFPLERRKQTTMKAARPAVAGKSTARSHGQPIQASLIAPIQAKLIVGASNDPHEREADRVAAEVMSRVQRGSTESSPARGASSPRGAANAGAESLIQRKCDACADEENELVVVRRKLDGPLVDAGDHASASPSGFAERLLGARTHGGRALDPILRTTMERGFGADFSRVKIRTDDHAASLTRQVQARAFTVGSAVFFNRGEFKPRDRSGQQLIAHELTHVLQQRDRGDVVRRVKDESGSPLLESQVPPAGEVARDRDGKTMAASLLVAVASKARVLTVFFDILQNEPSAQSLIEMSIAFIQEITDDVVITLLETPEGRTVARLAIRYASLGGHRATGSILQVHGRVGAADAQKIANTGEADNDSTCMKRALFNVKTALGDENVEVYKSTLKQGWDDADADADARAKQDNKPKKIKPLNSNYMHALTKLGHARYLGASASDRAACTGALVYGGPDAEANDPFTLINPDVALYRPDPEEMMLRAVAGATRGVYVFSASVQNHHTVTLILVKKKDGPVAKGAGPESYRLFWNDQYEDRPAAQKGRKTPKPVLGQELTGATLTDRIFRLTMTIHSDPANAAFGSRIAVDPQGHPLDRAAQGVIRDQRCSNNAGIRLWLLLPKHPEEPGP